MFIGQVLILLGVLNELNFINKLFSLISIVAFVGLILLLTGVTILAKTTSIVYNGTKIQEAYNYSRVATEGLQVWVKDGAVADRIDDKVDAADRCKNYASDISKRFKLTVIYLSEDTAEYDSFTLKDLIGDDLINDDLIEIEFIDIGGITEYSVLSSNNYYFGICSFNSSSR